MLLQAAPQAFQLRLLPETAAPDCVRYVVQFTPRPGYKALHIHLLGQPIETLLENLPLMRHVTGKIWISHGSFAVMQLWFRALQPIDIAGVLLRMETNSAMQANYSPVDGHWFLKSVHLHADFRIIGLGADVDATESYSHYRQFGASAKILSVGNKRQ